MVNQRRRSTHSNLSLAKRRRFECITERRIVQHLKRGGERASGKLYLEAFPDGAIDRSSCEHLLGALARAGLVELREAEFEREGKTIRYRKASLTAAGRKQLAREQENWARLTDGVGRVLRFA